MKLFPAHIKHIRVIAPAGPVEESLMLKQKKYLETFGVHVSFSKHLLNNTPQLLNYNSATIEARLEDLHAAFDDLSVDLVLCARGGYGTTQLLEHINWRLLQSRPNLPLLGFSDITALQLAMDKHHAALPIPSIHLNFFEEAISHEITRQSLTWALQPKGELHLTFKPTFTQKSTTATGRILACNLTMLQSLLGTPHLPNLDGVILLIEEIAEPVRKIDRTLNQLQQAGILNKISGLLMGEFTDCQSHEMLNACLMQWQEKNLSPFACGVTFGHTHPSIAVRNQARCRFTATPTSTEIIFYEF